MTLTNSAVLRSASEADGELVLNLRRPTTRYADEFLRLKCADDMVRLRLFPNFKEVTESFAAYNAVRRVWRERLQDPTVSVVVVGDGCTPRTAALFAHRSRWTCYSVDPRLRRCEWPVERLRCACATIQNVLLDLGPCAVVLVHAHVGVADALKRIHAPDVLIVAIPCCVPLGEHRPADYAYDDWGIWSQKRRVHVWLPQKEAEA